MAPIPLQDLVKTDEGLVSARIFIDPEIYQLELERIFGRSWLFVAHESELRQPGAFVTRWMGEDPVIASRGADGQIRVMLNACRHRGRKVCGEDAGRAVQFKCPYHGWTYAVNGQLVAVPFFEAYGGRLEKGEFGLYQAPRVDSYHGLIFANWDPDAEPLVDYLGTFRWVLDILFGRTEAMEVAGPPMRWTVGANWKLAAANFAGDGHHIFTTHGFRTALLLETLRGERTSYVVPTDRGHATTLTCWPKDFTGLPYLALPQELVPQMERRLSADQVQLLRSLMLVVGNVFPNLSYLDSASHTPEEWGGGPESPAMSFLTIRQWQPKGPDRMEVWSWLLLDRDAPETWKEASRACFYREFGMAGIFEQDDMENWAEITQTLRSPVARRLRHQYRMGLDLKPTEDWRGPGIAYRKEHFEELNERTFYGAWHRMIMREPLMMRAES